MSSDKTRAVLQVFDVENEKFVYDISPQCVCSKCVCVCLFSRLDPILYKKCQGDAARLCHTHGWNETSEMMPPGAIFSCLYRHAYRSVEQGRRVSVCWRVRSELFEPAESAQTLVQGSLWPHNKTLSSCCLVQSIR